MNSLLYQFASAMCAIVVLMAWLKPMSFRYLLDKGNAEPGIARISMFTALITSTWGFVTLVLSSNPMPEWFGTLYMLAWAGSQLGSVYMKIKGAQQPGSIETSSTSTTTKVTP